MQVAQTVVQRQAAADADFSALTALQPALVLAFGSVAALRAHADSLANAFPHACRAGCSTAGEISQDGVADDSLVVTALRFDAVTVRQASTVLGGMDDSLAAGRRLAQGLAQEHLRGVLLFGQGVLINGSAVLRGMAEVLGPQVPITGGLAGDGGSFIKTWVLDAQGASSDRLVCVGLYGDALVVSHGSFGGWSPFGPIRRVTRCDNNVLYELDGEPALTVYKRYLGEHAKGLPATGLLFPFAMLTSEQGEVELIRTILGIDEASHSLTFAGDIVPGGYLKLMHANTDALVTGAATAATAAAALDKSPDAGLALLVSCVGRKLVMGRRVHEEVEAVAQVFGQRATIAGFYSNGEISPLNRETECRLHNQTMTVTYIGELS